MARTLLTGYPELVPSASPPDDYQRIQSSPGAFGGIVGQAEEKAGAQVHQLGTELFKVYDETASTDAYTKYQNTVNSLLYGDPHDPSKKGYLELTGEEAMNARPQVLSRMEDLIGEIKGNLKTTESQIDFERASRRLQSYSLSQVGRHYDQEGKRWSVSTMDSALAGDERAIANTYNDDEFFKNKLEDMRGNAGKKAHLNGTDEKGAIAEADSRSVQARLNGALARRDFAAAQQIYDQYGSLLDDKVRAPYANHIHSGATSAEGDALANGALGLAPMPAASSRPSLGDVRNPGSLAMAAAAVDPAIEAAVAKRIATTSGLQHWAGIDPDTGKPWNPTLRAAFEAAGLPTDGPISEEQWKTADPLILKHESMGGQNVPNYRFDATHTAGGPHQITNSTWNEFGGPELMAGKGGAKIVPTGELEKAYPNDPRLKSGPLGTGGGTPAIEVWGDSLGVGLQGQLKTAGKVHGGDSPTTILANIEAQPEDSWQGKTVVLPSGSNGDEMHVVEQTIQYLKEHKANVIAVGYGPKFPEKNQALAAIAERQQVPVIAAEGVAASEGVHPSPQGYASMAQKIAALPKAQPIPTGPAGAPPRPTGEAPQNRSGLPPLTDIWDKVWNTPGFSDEARSKAWNKAKERYTAFEADAARSERIQAQQQKQAENEAIGKYQRDVYSDNPKLTARDVIADPAFAADPKMREHMIGFINNPPGSAIPQPQSWAAALNAIDRIRLPEGNPQKITDRDQLYKDYMRKVNKGEWEFINKEFDNIRTPGGELFAKRRVELMKRIQPFITKSNPLLGKLDPEGDGQLYNFEWGLDQKIKEYRDAGKNPMDLLDPSKPDFVGKPEFLTQFQTAMQQSAKAAASSINKTPAFPQPGQGQNPPPIPAPFKPEEKSGWFLRLKPGEVLTEPPAAEAPIPNSPARMPGETAADYMRRRNRDVQDHLGRPAAPQPAPPVR